MTDSIITLPASRPNRVAILKAVLLPLDTSSMDIADIVAICEAALPDCTAAEIRDALRECAEQHLTEADQLERYARQRGKLPSGQDAD